jgi:murein DD-endopeptidase MepM/ murein hydrolase activator NlpD
MTADGVVASLSSTAGTAPCNDFCQDDSVLRVRTLSGLTVVALCLAGCGAPGDGPSVAETPQFVLPSVTESAPAAPSLEPTVDASATPSTSPSAKKTTTPPKTDVTYAFPVKASNVAFHPTHGKYPATDIFADCGEPVVAATSGVILEISTKDTYVKGEPDGPANGGLSVSLLGDDGVRYYGSHLSRIQSGIKAGTEVKAGQRLGDVGRTGNANNVCHLHFGVSPPCAGTGDWKVRRGVIWPATYLTAWRKKTNKSPVAKVASWKRANNCKA